MAPTYVSAPRRPRAVQAGDDYWPETRETIEVICQGSEAIDTGLVDETGLTIYRRRVRMGF